MILNNLNNIKLENSKPTYISVINPLRGVASLMVCIYHLACMPHGLFNRSSLIYSIFKNGYFGVIVFFVITGVVIPNSLISGKYTYSLFGKFILKRVARIEPPYLASIVLFTLYKIFKNFYHHD